MTPYVAPSVRKRANKTLTNILHELREGENKCIMAFLVFGQINPDKVREGDDFIFCGGFGWQNEEGLQTGKYRATVHAALERMIDKVSGG